MRTIVSGLMALICASVFAQSARSQTAPASPIAPPILKGAGSGPGDAPAPPILRKSNAFTPSLPESSEHPTAQKTEQDQAEVSEEDIVRVSTSLITVPAQVMDRNGRFIGSLRKEDFLIYENGIEQQLSYFGSVEQPFTVALLLDVSGSTQTQLQAIRVAANAFISRLRPNDQLLIVSFDGKINFLTDAVKITELRKHKFRLDAVNDGTLLY